MALRVAVDFGTSSTCVAASVHGREPEVVVVDGQPLLPSAVYAGTDGTLFVGLEAERQAALDPSRYEPHPKRRVDEAELLLGDAVVPTGAVFAAVLGRAVREARRVAGGAPVELLVLTHPADWGGRRTQVLRRSAAGLAARVELVPEPVAAAVFHSASFPAGAGAALAVLDLGGGTVDVSVVRTVPGHARAFRVLATRGDPGFGGADVDQLLLDHIGSLVAPGDPDAWRSLVEGRDLPDRRRRRVLRQDVRGAKETLSRHAYTDVPLPPPFPDAHVTRDDLEGLIAAPVGRAVGLTLATVEEAGLTPGELAGIFLVGGSSRIPLVARLVAERTGVVPVTLDQPETVVARGALRAVAVEPDHTGLVPPALIQPGPYPAPPGRPTAPPAAHPATPAAGQRSAFPAGRPGSPHPGPFGPTPAGRPGSIPPGHSAAFPPAHPVPSPPGRPGPPVAVPLWRRPAAWIAAALVASAAAVAALLVLPDRDGPDPGRVIAQYEYRFALPEGWLQTGGDPGRLRTEIKPEGAEQGADLILVEERRLSFDSDADRARALDRLRAEFEAGGDAFADFTERASFAGRDVVHYRERLDNEDATADWYVLFRGGAQVSVGCQHTGAGREMVRQACDAVVRSMAITG